MSDMKGIESFRKFTIEELELVLKGVGGCAGPDITVYEWFKKLDKYTDRRKLLNKKGVLIITECDHEHYVEPNQGVKEVYVDGVLVYSLESTAKRDEE